VIRAVFLVAFLGALLFSGPFDAWAADLLFGRDVSPGAAYFTAPNYWEGLYAGSSLGQAYSPSDDHRGHREGDFIGGGQLGYNWQFGAPVFGIEADLQGLNGSAIDSLASLRARAGVAASRVMIYGTFGVAGVRTRARTVLADTAFGPDVLSNRSQTRAGVIGGAGAEAFISETMSLKAEYLYAKFGDYDAFSSFGGRVRLPLDAHIIRLGLNYHFGRQPLDFAFKGLRPYIGAGASYVHHTGRDGDHPISTEKYEPGGKVFAGAFLNDWIAVETAYNYLGRAPATRLSPVGLVPTHETSSSIGASALAFSDPLFPWWDGLRSVAELRLFSRAGLAYKMTEERGGGFSRSDSGPVLNVGSGLQVDFQQAFLRVEYEYLSRVETHRVIDIRHTPLSLSAGVKF
jgi:outer membrane immunogenic protein